MEYSGTEYAVEISGLLGGHSGTEIHLGRANANKLMGRLLFALSKDVEFALVHIQGGAKDNAIARDAKAVVVIPQDQLSGRKRSSMPVLLDFQNEYRAGDPEAIVSFQQKRDL